MNQFSYIEITGKASAFGMGSDWFMYAPDGVRTANFRNSEEAFDTFFEWKESACFFEIKMEHVIYTYGDDQDPYEVPLRLARSIERSDAAHYVCGGMGVYC